MDQNKSNEEYDKVIHSCRTEFFKKNSEYGQSWQRYRAASLLEKICIKLERIQTIQQVGQQKVEDTVASEFPAIINYSILGKVKCREWENGVAVGASVSLNELEKMYDNEVTKTKEVFVRKNHDYGESWRKRTIGFMVDEMLTKFDRAATIHKSSLAPEKKRVHFEEIFTDICNYAVFCKILTDEGIDVMV